MEEEINNNITIKERNQNYGNNKGRGGNNNQERGGNNNHEREGNNNREKGNNNTNIFQNINLIINEPDEEEEVYNTEKDSDFLSNDEESEEEIQRNTEINALRGGGSFYHAGADLW